MRTTNRIIPLSIIVIDGLVVYLKGTYAKVHNLIAWIYSIDIKDKRIVESLTEVMAGLEITLLVASIIPVLLSIAVLRDKMYSKVVRIILLLISLMGVFIAIVPI